MFGNHFYNEGVRKLVIGFGQVFNNIYVQNTASDGAVTKRLRVPLAYAPKEKFLVRLDQQANASYETTKKMAQELGADFMMIGNINSIVDENPVLLDWGNFGME